MLAQVAVPLPVLRTFTYAIPDELRERAAAGARVLVPFTRGERIGWIERVVEGEPTERTRFLTAILDPTPSVPPGLLRLCRWTADYYIAPLGQVLRTALPSALSTHSTEMLELVEGAALDELTEIEEQLIGWLGETAGARAATRLRRDLGERSWWPVIRRLEERGIVRVTTERARQEPAVQTRRVLKLTRELPSLAERDMLFRRAKKQRECWEWVESVGGVAEVAHLNGQLSYSYPVINGLVEKGLAVIEEQELQRDPYASIAVGEAPALTPTVKQREAIDALVASARTPKPATFLLRGVTGSGKTLVYIELLREIVDVQGRTAIVLVPEIALTPQTVGRFKAVFGDRVAVLHSALSDGERYDEWRALRAGEKRIAVGARSAIFAPLPDLGAIIVDEEHEGSYKQGEAPRYHAREVAVVRAAMEGALCLLGSATPSLESWVNATSGKYGLLELPERAAGQPLPDTRVVDLRAERKSQRESSSTKVDDVVLSRELEKAIGVRLEKGEQTILLLNRRGYANFVQCRDCGHVWDCPSCAVSLTFHRRRSRLTCHYCMYEEDTPQRCSRCASTDISFRGVGTEQVERAVEEAYPNARIARMDVDTTSAKWSHHRILEKVGSGEVDILMGTQMIAKGLDFPNVTLVGVINADVGINLPDFRATERTFQLLTQVAGRAGRGPKGGEVLIQSSLPNHYAVTCSLEHDFHGFAKLELAAREEPSYPPFRKLVNIVFSGLDQPTVEYEALRAADWLRGLIQDRKLESVTVTGPAPAPIERIRDRWRWHLLLKSSSSTDVGKVTRYFAERFRVPAGKHDMRLSIDRDPVALL